MPSPCNCPDNRRAIGISDLQDDLVFGMRNDRPVGLAQPIAAAMQMRIAVLVQIQLIMPAIQRELTLADSIGDTPRVAPK